jgi:lipopolysaccharide/colanic/teichoic acid biosynthesis glycosyltransferase
MMTKRIFDVLVSMLALVLLSPLLLVIAIWIRRDSAGPIIFRQQRVGRGGIPFDILKFRSMRATNDGLQITVSGDSRITRSGEVLRKYKLDELPQLWNVLVGDMSLVGPRPEVPHYVKFWGEAASREILAVRPGITDPTALEMFDESALLATAADPERKYIDEILPVKVAGYLHYVRTRSFAGDVQAILRTIVRAMRG